MTDVFVSGWCGFPSIFGSFSDRFEFFTPFYDDLDTVFDKKGRNLVCWSTGANLALKQKSLSFENIILVSPFLGFTDFTPERVLKRMIKKFETEPEAVIADFMTACGVKSFDMSHADFGRLKTGLEYLLDSGGEIGLKAGNITVLHGENDSVVSIKAGEEIASTLGCEFVRLKNCGHFVPADVIAEFLI